MARVLLLEDEVDFREEIADFLGAEGYTVLQAGSIEEFVPLIDQIDMALIDVGLPDGSGMAAAAALRAAKPSCGIIMLTALGGVSNRIASLRESADYYLVKPVSFDELLAYLAAMERRVVTPWRLHIVERQLLSPEGHTEALSESEMVLLQLLAENNGAIVTRRMIAAAFGIDWLQYEAGRLDQMVSRLRRRWRAHSGMDLPFRTEHGKGYSFCARIDKV